MGDLLAAIYDPLIAPFDPMGVRRWRRWAVAGAAGRVLELGVGTGLNLPHYATARSVMAIDPNGPSLDHARDRITANGRAYALQQSRAEELPFADESFDSVVGTLTFCTIREPAVALAEARRVLKSGGEFRLVEHVRVHNRVFAGAQDLATPLWSKFAGGCHLNRDTLSAVEQAGFRVRGVRRLLGGLFIGIDAVK
ncbi:MAG: class I SAM-dependent methyltransferase [Chloroflexi bacterium]|nr:class I SAM-dependent methyltransferase [Chloroflexota bacterium]